MPLVCNGDEDLQTVTRSFSNKGGGRVYMVLYIRVSPLYHWQTYAILIFLGQNSLVFWVFLSSFIDLRT